MQIIKDVQKDKFCTLIFLLSLLYVMCLFPIYLNDFLVPDMRLYSSFVQRGSASKDGFSSLFIAISGLINLWPSGLLIFSLLSMASCMFFLAYFYKKLFSCGDWKIDVLVVTAIYSCSIWYYLYGKLFYDFPLTAANLSAVLYMITRIWNEDGKKRDIGWYFLCVLLGLLLSWKPYNIFICTGLAILMLCIEKGRKIYLQNLCAVKTFLCSVLSFLFGYLVGNFNFFLSPIETIEGLQAYHASYDFHKFLFFNGRIIWDHVNAFPFQFSSMLVSTAIVILFIIPVILKKYEYLVTSVFMSLCFYVFISHYSPGYPWHGFPFAVFILLQFIFLSGEISTGTRKKAFICISCLFILLQTFICFSFYIPKQIKWIKTTKDSIEVCQKYENEIYEKTQRIIEKYGNNYCIDLSIKRFTVYPKGPLHLKQRNKDSIYLYADNYIFADCLETSDYNSWNELYKNGQAKVSRTPKALPAFNEIEYVIYIVPNCFLSLAECANINKYSSYEKLDEFNGSEYYILIYKMKK